MGVNPRRLRFIGRPAGRSAFRSVAKRPNYAGIGDEEADPATAQQTFCEEQISGGGELRHSETEASGMLVCRLPDTCIYNPRTTSQIGTLQHFETGRVQSQFLRSFLGFGQNFQYKQFAFWLTQ
jgi:putative hemolysin